MSIEFFRHRPGQPRARCTCSGDECGRDEVFACPMDETGRAVAKVVGMGWENVKGRLFCPACKAKRKGAPMSRKTPAPSPSEAAPRQPSREQRRQIVTELTECYDVDAGHYKGDATDDQVAVLLDVMPGWVVDVRREFFGDDGSNADMAVTAKDIEAEIAALQAVLRDCEDAASAARVAIRTAQDLAGRVDAIRKAVGPRHAGVATK